MGLEEKDSKISNLTKKNREEQLLIDQLKKQNAELINQMSGLQVAMEELKRTVTGEK